MTSSQRAAVVGATVLVVGALLLAAVTVMLALSARVAPAEHAAIVRVPLDVLPSPAPARAASPRGVARVARPVRLSVPAIGVDAPIVPVGLDPGRVLEVPRDFVSTGWWTGGA